MKLNNNETNDTKKSSSWTLVIFLLLIFWPVGLYFLVRKLSIDRKASLTSGKKMIIWGWIIAGMGVISWSSLIEDGFFSGTIGMLFFVGAGLALVYIGKKSSVNAVKYKKYIDLIINKRLRSISTIASAMPVQHDVALSEINEMIEKGFFENAYINFNTDEILFIYSEEDSAINELLNQKVEMELVKCTGCGANNKVEKGEVGKCQYCGSFISS